MTYSLCDFESDDDSVTVAAEQHRKKKMKVARDPRHECCEIAADVLQPFSGLFVAAHRIRILSAMPCGAQIIDLMMLVIDVTKGMQTQSAECLVIGQIACQKLVVVLNKTDLLAEGKRQAAIEKMTRKMQKTLENTKFRGAPIIPVAARPGGPEAPETEAPQGISELIELLTSQIPIPARDPSGPFLMSVDHCFSIKGQGTVMTGTILSGSVSLGDSVEIPALKVSLLRASFWSLPPVGREGTAPWPAPGLVLLRAVFSPALPAF
ncbi:Selenocysteine-specific elongation factor [Camelus dromedarius]|uniref:Selenocysteine-specific elongation factor n=1 Tax=Camelus dromedarius TaxID=9838 RepID=A0A5N4CYH1_CAMDR|nr:Selenocysteine-specific elongation factor [Camelus dromedarius]